MSELNLQQKIESLNFSEIDLLRLEYRDKWYNVQIKQIIK